MKYYWCVLPLTIGVLQAWGADAGRVVYHIETVAGSSRIGDGGPALAAQFSSIKGIAIDRLGNLYLSDTENHRVRKVSGDTVTTIAGTGVAGFSGDGKSALNAQLNFPYGLALDSAGNLYVADYGNQVVRKIAPDGTITTVAGTGKRASSPDDAGPLNTSLLSPRNVAVDGAGNLYIAEYEGHRVRKLTPDGKLSTVAGTGVAAWSGDHKLATDAQLKHPAGMAFDRTGALYIADSGNNVVRKVYVDGTIGTVLGQPPGTPMGVPAGNLPWRNLAMLSTPIALAVDEVGTIYVGEAGSHAVWEYTPAGKWIPYVGGGGSCPGGNGGGAACGTLSFLYGLAADVTGNLWIADGVRVRRVDAAGTFQTVAGDGYLRAVGDGGPATAANLYRPSAVTLDRAGNVFIVDTGTQRVRQVAAGGTITTLAGTGVAGRLEPLGGPAANAALSGPAGVTMDAAGNVIIADAYNNRIVAVNGAHQLVAVAGVAGTPGESADGVQPVSPLTLYWPQAVCTDRGGNLYIGDTGNHRVLKLSPGGVLQTVAGNGSVGYAGDGGVARLAQLNSPSACAVDSAGTLFIADTGNHAIRKVTGGTISTVAGLGVPGASGDEGPATIAQLASPRGVVVDDMGDIFIADTGHNRILQVTPDGGVHDIAGSGAAGFAGDGGPAAGAVLNSPQGLFLDGAGNLYFADTGNNRVRRLLPDAVAPAPVIELSIITVVNAISLREGAVAPGEIAAIFGAGLGPDVGVTGALDAAGVLAGMLGGVEVRFDGVAAPIFYAQSGQVNVQVPYTVAGKETVPVEVRYLGKPAGAASLPVAPSAPAMLTLATNPDGSPNAASAPAPRSTWMTFYATGEGLTDGPNVAGKPAQAPYPHPLLPVALTIAGVNAEILFVGSAPDMIGVLQINARIPGGFIGPGETAVELTVGTAKAPPIAIWLK